MTKYIIRDRKAGKYWTGFRWGYMGEAFPYAHKRSAQRVLRRNRNVWWRKMNVMEIDKPINVHATPFIIEWKKYPKKRLAKKGK